MHPLIERAAAGELPGWACAGEKRRAHVARVSELTGRWADELGLDLEDRARWRAAGLLHDALHDADADTLRPLVQPDLADLPAKMLHGPAAAARLRDEGVDDAPLLLAIGFHTIGHPELDALGRALYIADYVEPGREYSPEHLAALRARMPSEIDGVARAVAAERIGKLLAAARPLRPETCGFWNGLIDG